MTFRSWWLLSRKANIYLGIFNVYWIMNGNALGIRAIDCKWCILLGYIKKLKEMFHFHSKNVPLQLPVILTMALLFHAAVRVSLKVNLTWSKMFLGDQHHYCRSHCRSTNYHCWALYFSVLMGPQLCPHRKDVLLPTLFYIDANNAFTCVGAFFFF